MSARLHAAARRPPLRSQLQSLFRRARHSRRYVIQHGPIGVRPLRLHHP